MQVKSIAECSKGSILQYFRPSLSFHFVIKLFVLSIFEWPLKTGFTVHCGTQYSSLDKQRICVNTQLKSSKKQLKLNACVPKSNSVDRYAITCDVIAYNLVHFISICVIYKCQSGIDIFLTSEHTVSFQFMNKISAPVKYFSGKTLQNGCD